MAHVEIHKSSTKGNRVVALRQICFGYKWWKTDFPT